MEYQKTLKEEPVEYEIILDEEEMTVLKKADQAYEAWREENHSKEGEAE